VGEGRVGPLKERHAEELAALERDLGVDESGRGWPPGMRHRVLKRQERLERYEQRRAIDLALDDVGELPAGPAGRAGRRQRRRARQPRPHRGAARDAQRLPAADVVRALAAVARCREALDRNGNPELQLERLLMAIALPLFRVAA
jgi:DNA polymerase III subunit delta'